MKQKTFNILFFLKKARLLKNGEAPICMRITVNRRPCEILIGHSAPVDQWDQAKGKVRGKSRVVNEINLHLEVIRAKIFAIYRELEMADKEITAEIIRNKYRGIEQEKKTLLEAFAEHNKEARSLIGKDFALKTVQRYEATAVYLKSFLQKEYTLSDMPLANIDVAFIRKFDTYLKVTRKNTHNSAVNRLKHIKKILGIALTDEIIKKNPFDLYKFKIEKTGIEFLTMEELEALMKKEFSIERLEVVRDIFVFCCFSGLAFSDVYQLNDEHLVKDSNGALWIRKSRQKTGNMCNIPVMKVAEKLIDKYREHPYCILNKRLFPVSSNQKMNGYLKELADLCGINKKLTTHVARYTCATTVLLGNEVSLENVAKILGHSDTKMTQHYARVLDSSIMRDIQNVELRFG